MNKSLYICNWIASESNGSGVTTRLADNQTVRASAYAEPLGSVVLMKRRWLYKITFYEHRIRKTMVALH